MRPSPGRILASLTVVGLLTALTLTACKGSGQVGAPAPAAPTTHHAADPSPEPLRAGEHFVELQMPQAYTPVPPEGGTDEYRCFLIDPKLTQQEFLTGSQFLPQNADIVHHAILFRVQPEDVAQAKQLDANDKGEGWTCFGGTGLGSGNSQIRALNSGSAWVAAWAPGGHEVLMDPKLGYKLEPGSQIVMQMHYNLLATGGKATGSDQSSIRLRLTENTGMRALQTTLIPAPVELPCTPAESGPLCNREKAVLDLWSRFGQPAAAAVAGLNLICNNGKDPVAGNTQHCDVKVREAGSIYAVAGHMHLLGRTVKVELNPGTAGAKLLLDVPVYNFDDQGARILGGPVKVAPGDVLRVTCTHDASLRSQLPQLKPLKPRYVVWGDGTSDEMCLGIVTWAK